MLDITSLNLEGRQRFMNGFLTNYRTSPETTLRTAHRHLGQPFNLKLQAGLRRMCVDQAYNAAIRELFTPESLKAKPKPHDARSRKARSFQRRRLVTPA